MQRSPRPISNWGGEESRCAWLRDKFEVSWQIVPRVLLDMLHEKDSQKVGRVTQAMLQMDKMDFSTLEQAYHRE